MATGGRSSPPQPRNPVTSLTDCPHCGSLCLGPTILPCGHLSCRRCLHDLLQPLGPRAACKQCGQHLDLPSDQSLTVSQFVQQMGTDPVMEQLVHQELEKDPDIQCLHCPNTQAASVCLDCKEYNCDACVRIHKRSRATESHALQQLAQALRSTTSVSPVTPRPRSSSVSSTSSLDSIRNIADSQSHDVSRGRSGGVKEWKEWVMKEVDLLQQASSEHQDVQTCLQDVMSMGQQLLNKMHTHQQVLDIYHQHLPGLDVIQQRDLRAYVIGVRGSDVSMDVKTMSMERRLCDVKKCRQCPNVSAVERIKKQLGDLLNSADQDQSQVNISGIQVTSSSIISTTTSTSVPLPPLTTTTTNLTFPPSVDVKPCRLFQSSATTADDRRTPWITSIVCLPDGRVMMTDLNNDKVKVIEESSPHAVTASLAVAEGPRRLAVLPDGEVAMTTGQPIIYLMTVTDTVTVTSKITTDRHYWGIAWHSAGQLVVSCCKSSTHPATLDILTRKGDLVRTVTDSSRLPGLMSPVYLCDAGDNHVLASDCESHKIYVVDVSSGQATLTHQHTDMKGPEQVCVDSADQFYVASYYGHCVLVRDRAGEWRRLLTGSQHSDAGYDCPEGLCLTRSGHLVVTWGKPGSLFDTVLIGYKLK